MGLVSKVFLTVTFLFVVVNTEINAAWEGPSTVLSGGWGAADDQFGIEYGDTNDMFAGPFYPLPDGGIIIRDVLNARYKVYNGDGSIKKILKCIEISSNVFNEECNIEGSYLQDTSDGNIWVDASKYQNPKYSLYSPTGQLIQTYTEKPAELGKVKSSNLGENNYKITITYPDKVYGFTSDRKFTRYIRDSNGYVYGVNAGGVWRFNQCGKLMGTVLMPTAKRQETARSDGGENIVTVHEEYGAPIVAPNGDVYTWKRTPEAYSILKWTWTDDPNPPSNAPDTPESLSIKIPSTGINLFWKAVAQDPGCVTGYEIVRSTTSGGPYTTLATVGAGTANATGWIKYTDTTAEIGRTYYYKVRAVAGTEYSAYTAEISGKR
jgi:hypothetical protein